MGDYFNNKTKAEVLFDLSKKKLKFVVPDERVVNGKRKKTQIWTVFRAATAKGTLCTPFYSTVERSVPILFM